MYLFKRRNSLPLILQAEVSECGLACLAMIACFHGKRIDIATLRHRFSLSAAGASVRHLLEAAVSLELRGRPLRLELKELHRLALPVILHWDLDHFVVLKKVSRASAVIHDPAVGIRRYRRDELGIHFTGVAVEFQPLSKFVAEDLAARVSLQQLLPKYAGFWKAIRQVFVLSLLLQLLALLSPLYLQLAIDQGINKGDLELIPMLALLFFIVVFSRVLLSYFRGLLSLHFSNGLGFQLVGNTFEHLLRLPLAFFEKREMGDIVSRFSSLDSIKQLVSQEMITVVVDGLFSSITLVLLFLYSPLLAWVALAFVLLLLMIRLTTIPFERHLRQEVLVSGAKQQSRFMENIRSITTTKNHNLERQRVVDWHGIYANYINAGYHLGRFQLGIGSTQSLLIAIDNLLTIYLGAIQVIAGQLSLGQLMGFIFLKQHFASSVSAMLPKLAELRLLKLELERVADISQQEPESWVEDCGLLQRTVTGNIAICNLTFRYSETDRPIFSDLNFKIEAGNCVAITGPSGCGKTTILKLILGLEQPETGEILVDGFRLQEFGMQRYRQQVSAIMHNEGLLAGDLSYNIGLGQDPIDTRRLHTACVQADILDLIESLPLGFNTGVSEMGNLFSAGQIQRILLARAFYRRPRLLVMDEALSHLEDEAANRILMTVGELGITAILVTHNRNLITQADATIDLSSSTRR